MKKNLLPVVLIAGLIVIGIFLYLLDSTKTDKVAEKNSGLKNNLNNFV